MTNNDYQSKFLQELGENQLEQGPLVHVLEKNLYSNGLIIELGTGNGKTANLIAGYLPGGRELHTFDWFHGRVSDWRPRYTRGDYNRNGEPPSGLGDNVTVHVGKFADTCPQFAKAHKGERAALIYVDCDEYQSTKDGLNGLASLIRDGTIIVFDEFLNYPGCEQHEMKAFHEFLNKNKKVYQVLGGYGGIQPINERYRSNWRNQKAAFYVYTKSSGAPPVPSLPGGLIQRSATMAASSTSQEIIDPTPRIDQTMTRLRQGQVKRSSTFDKGDKRIVLVVTYGRRRYFRSLLPYILRELDLFDEVVLWKNTKDSNDLKFLDDVLNALRDKGLRDKFTSIHPAKVTGTKDGVFPVYRKLNDPKTVYIKIDDDVVWVAPGGFTALAKFAIDHEDDYAVFSANMVNSGPADVLHQRQGASASEPLVFKEKNPYKNLLTSSGAAQVHESLQNAVASGEESLNKYVVEHVFVNSPRWSINCIAFFGNLFNDRDYKKLEEDDERYISRNLSKKKNKNNAIAGSALMAHYSFESQRTRRKLPGRSARSKFGKDSELLDKYTEWAEALYQ